MVPDHWTLEEIAEWDTLKATFKTGEQSGTGRTCIFDIEADGLLRAQGSIQQATQLWCIGAMDVATGEKFYWGYDQEPGWIEHSLKFLSECHILLAHNGVDFDYAFLEECYGWKRPERSWDTMIIAKYLWPVDVLAGPDFNRAQRGLMPMKYVKRHSLAAWGYRTGTHKVDYSGGFDAWRPAMASYLMTGDLEGPLALWKLALTRLGWDPEKPAELVTPERTIEVEHKVAQIIKRQELDGIKFDLKGAIALASQLRNDQAALERKLVDIFGSWWQPLSDPEVGEYPARSMSRALPQFPDVTIRRFSEKTGKELAPYVGPPQEHFEVDAPFVRIERTTFNPSSRDHLGQRLQDIYGWKPKKFGANGKPTVDEGTLEEIPEAVIPPETRQAILDYFVVTKTLGMLSKGQKAWITLCNRHSEIHGTQSRLHGSMDTIGAVTRRGIHKDPNLGQVPAVRKEKVVGDDGVKREVPLLGLAGRYGVECRALFTADDGWEQTGVDASSLELIDLGHYLFPKDGGKFSDRVCDPSRDAHSEHAEITGTARGDAKTAIYLKVYGGSAFKLSQDRAIIVTEDMIPDLLSYRGLPALLRSLEKRFDADFVRKMDDMQRARLAHARKIIIKLEAGIEGLKGLSDDVTDVAKARGWLKAIDGSRIHVRKAHAALNSLLQSAGAISCKVWIVRLHEELERRGLRLGVDYKQVLWVHDELQFTHKPGLGPVIKEAAELCMVQAGEELGLRGRYRTDGKTGKNWAECH